jgi:hypothetical protein
MWLDLVSPGDTKPIQVDRRGYLDPLSGLVAGSWTG